MNFAFSTVSTVPVPNTSLSGIIVDPGPDAEPLTDDDFDPGRDSVPHTEDDKFLLPISGVQVFLLGLEDDIVFTDEDGWFTFDTVPTGNVKLMINGTTASSPPDGFYFPEMVMDINVEVGIENFAMAGMPQMYLPRLPTEILHDVAVDGTTMIVADEVSAPDLSPEQRRFLAVEIQPNSLISASGEELDSGQVGISTVPPELVRDMLPPGVLQHTFDITVQAPGITNFSTPAPMTFPNVFDAPPGTKLNFLSFDHTTGRLVIEGTGTVSDDGLYVSTDAGTGITHPGWHGLAPPASENEQPCDSTATHDVDVEPVPVTNGLDDYLFVDDDGTFTLSFGNAAESIDSSKSPCDSESMRATPLVVEIQVTGSPDDFLDGLSKSYTFELQPQQQKNIELQVKELLTDDNIDAATENILYGVTVEIEGTKFDDPSLLIDERIFVYRFFDIADDSHTDGLVDFEKTYGHSSGKVSQTKPLTLEMPDPVTIAAAKGDDFEFKTDKVSFTPSTVGEKTDSLQITTPDGDRVDDVALRGTAVDSVFVNLNKSDFTIGVEQLVDKATPLLNTSGLLDLFPEDSDADGLRSDEPGFQEKLDSIYSDIVSNLEAVFGFVGVGAGSAIVFAESTTSAAILVNWFNRFKTSSDLCQERGGTACAGWADFGRDEFKIYVSEESSSSVLQEKFRFDSITNRSPDDPEPSGAFSGVVAYLDRLVKELQRNVGTADFETDIEPVS